MRQQLTHELASDIYNLDKQIQGIYRKIERDLPKNTVEIIRKYDRVMINASMAKSTRRKHLQTLYVLSKMLGKEWGEVTKEDIDVLVSKIMEKFAEPNCIRLVKRLRREKEMLFTFLEIDDNIEWHNNAAERAIRPNVIIRKITNGHRTEGGAVSHKILMSVKETCRMRGLNFYDYALQYLGRIASKS